MLFGKPTIATSVGGTSLLVKNGSTGILIPPKAPNVLKTEILRLLTNDSYAHNLGENARKHVLNQFKYTKMVNKIETLYSRVTHSH
jgi:glycosyltransferase involved in cell wall biosynthesis